MVGIIIKGLRPCRRPQEFQSFFFFRDFGFSMHGMCRCDHFDFFDFSSTFEFWKCSWLLLRRSFLGRATYIFWWKCHKWTVWTYIFWPKVHTWVVRTLYFLKKWLKVHHNSGQLLKSVLFGFSCRSSQFANRDTVIWAKSRVDFWKGSLHMGRKSAHFSKRVLIYES